jgi:hypothetical protein
MAKAIRLSAVSCAVGVAAILLLGVSAGFAAAETAQGQKFRRPQVNPTATVIPLGRATISGTGVPRTGSGAAKLGGPAKASSGINGTTMRPKH